ncbi:MAG TPA: NRAMP family divalent metal transporter [Candidatus Dormibacteraeota bacterium]|nr:NRAMP family divalent metal transporter [Candidatus Dormibacteraeota bacterium]
MSEREPNGKDSRLKPTSAVLDEMHLGDIHGAFGTIRVSDVAPRRTWRRRILTLLAVLGPGIIVMVGDNDAGGVTTYSQAGQDFGYSLLWTLLLLVPVLIVNQEMVVRLGAVTGVGHARLIKERFGKFWAAFSVGDLFILNFLTIATEFVGVKQSSEYFGMSKWLVVPLAAGILIGITASGNFRRWERAMFVFLGISLLVIPLAVMAHPDPGAATRGFLIPSIHGGFTSTAALLIIAIVGTTVAPWQLFFQQSNVIDKRITPRWFAYEKADTVIGSVVVVIGASAIIMATASVFSGTREFGNFSDALSVALGFRQHNSYLLGAIYAVLLFDASIVGASAVTLATSYAFGDIFGIRHSLHRGFREAKLFYGMYAGMVVVAAALVLVSNDYLASLITVAVQALAGVLLPSASVFLVLLCNDIDVLGPWVNKPWLNIVATVIVSVLLELSLILIISTIFTSIDVTRLVVVLTAILIIAMVVAAVLIVRSPARAPQMSADEKANWRMPALALLQPAKWSLGRRIAVLAMQVYLGIAVLLLVVKAVQIALGHH